MAFILLTAGARPQLVDGTDDPILAEAAGPAVLLGVVSAVADPRSSAGSTADCVAGPYRPLAYRETRADWTDIDFEAADHWVQMGPELRCRLVEDHLETLDVSEFKIATNGASASITTNNWVYSGSPRTYRAAGRLRELVTVLGELTREA